MNMLSTGLGLSAVKDPIYKQKYWKNTVQFTREDRSSYETVFKTNAAKHNGMMSSWFSLPVQTGSVLLP